MQNYVAKGWLTSLPTPLPPWVTLTCCCIILMFIRLSFVHFPFPLRLPAAAAHLCANLPSTSCASCVAFFSCFVSGVRNFCIPFPECRPTTAKTRQKFSLQESVRKVAHFLYARHQVALLAASYSPSLLLSLSLSLCLALSLSVSFSPFRL